MPRLLMRLSVVAVALAASAAALGQSLESLPPRKPGQWEIQMITEKPAGVPQIVSQVCIDPASDREIMEFGLRMSKDACKRFSTKREGKTYVIDAECAFGPIKSVTRTTMSGDFQSSYSVRIEGTSEGGFPGAGNAKGAQSTLMVHTAKWAGAVCKNGMKPGDIAMAGGMKFNIKQLKGLQKMLPQLQVR